MIFLRLSLTMLLTCMAACSTAGYSGKSIYDSEHEDLKEIGISASLSARLKEPDNRCQGLTELTEVSVSERLGLDKDRLIAFQRSKGLTFEDICSMPARRLARAIYKSRYPDHPEEWAKLRAKQQASEDGKVKSYGLINALAQRKQLMSTVRNKPSAGGISKDRWTFLGPGNIGGRIRSITIHPTNTDNMWVGSVSGGIWKTTNSGVSWNPVNDFMANLAVSAIVIDPADPDTMYAGTGESFASSGSGNFIDAVRGYGVFKSTDGGNTWNHLSSTAPSDDTGCTGSYNWHYVNRLAISSSGVILAGTGGYYKNCGAVYRSTDGGDTWTNVFTGRIYDLRFDPGNPNNAVANAIDYNFSIGRYESHIIRSTNAGQTWAKVKTFVSSGSVLGRIELAYAQSNPQVIYASFDNSSSDSGEIYKSTNGGISWTLTSTPRHLESQGSYDNSIWVSPTDPNLVVIGGIDLYRSENGGITWDQISLWWKWPESAHADQHAIVSHPGFNGTSNKTVFFGNDGGIWKAEDITSGFTMTEFYEGRLYTSIAWTNLNNSLGVTQFYGGAGSAGAGKIIGGTQDNGHLMFTGSTTWKQTNGGDGGFAAVDPTDSNYMYGEYVYLNLYRSTDGGNNYTDICSGITEAYSSTCGGTDDALFIAPFMLDPNNSNTMLAGAASLWRSISIKAANPSWTPVKSPVYSGGYKRYISAIAVAEGNSDIIWVGHENGAVYRTSNGTVGNPTWSSVSGLPSRYITRILIDKDNPDKVYVALGGYDPDNLYMTTNNGVSWTDISGNMPSAPARTIVRHPANADWLYAGTEVGIYTSEDGGTTWSTSNDGPANVSVDELFWYGNNRLVAATHGRGMFAITVGGASCEYSITPTASSFTPSGGTGSVNITASSGSCEWIAVSTASWIKIDSAGSGTGSGALNYSVSPNTSGVARTGDITIGGRTITITQSSAGKCTALLYSQDSDYYLNVPVIKYANQYYSVDFIYKPDTYNILFRLTGASGISDITPYSNCEAATLSTDLKIHIPALLFGDSYLWLDMQNYPSSGGEILFKVINYGVK